MSKERKKIIENFCKRFLNIEKTPKSFSDILNESPIILKGCNKKYEEILSKNNIKKIRDLSKIKIEKIEKTAEKLGIDSHQLRLWVMAAGLVSRAWQKRSAYLNKKDMKIAVLGLDNAGKTSMLETISGKTNFGEISNLEPTVGIAVRKMELENFNIIIWDYGGQIDHRHDYMNNPEENFLQIDLVMYVIDMQDDERYDESIDYLRQILDIIKFLNEMPYFLIMLHKCDPDIVNDPDFQINLEFVRDEVEKLFKDSERHYEVIETSIYNFYATEPEFAKLFKRFFVKKTGPQTLEESIAALSETLMNLSTTILQNFNEIKTMLSRAQIQINKPSVSKSNSMGNKDHIKAADVRIDIPTPPPPPTSNKIGNTPPPSVNPLNTRKDLMSELKNVLRMRRVI